MSIIYEYEFQDTSSIIENDDNVIVARVPMSWVGNNNVESIFKRLCEAFPGYRVICMYNIIGYESCTVEQFIKNMEEIINDAINKKEGEYYD